MERLLVSVMKALEEAGRPSGLLVELMELKDLTFAVSSPGRRCLWNQKLGSILVDVTASHFENSASLGGCYELGHEQYFACLNRALPSLSSVNKSYSKSDCKRT